MAGPRRRRSRRIRRPRIRGRFDLKRAMFVLPNLFTVSSIFCGFYAIVLASGDPGPQQLFQATLAIFFGMFFDMADGRVARLTRTQSEFGVQLDSLADLVTFGVATALVVFKWGLASLGKLGVAVAFTYVACGALRLARFNVMAQRAPGPPAVFFTGLPIPLAAGLLISLVMFHQSVYAAPAVRTLNIVALILVISYLMVSNVRYRTFKGVKLARRTVAIGIGLVALFTVVAVTVRPTFAMLSFISGYIALGLIEEVVFFKRRRRSRQNTPAPGAEHGGQAPSAPQTQEESTP